MYYELQCADRVGDALEVVALAVGEVIHGVYFPCRAGAVVGCLDDAVHDGVAEVHVGRRHVDFRTEHTGSLIEFACVHAHEEVEVFFGRAVAVRAFLAGSLRSAFLTGDFLAGLVVDISFALLDEAYGQIEELGEIIAGVVLAVTPVETEPVNVFANRIHIFHVFLHGVGVVETQIACAAEFLGDAKVHAYGFCMAYMEVSVGLGRKTGA